VPRNNVRLAAKSASTGLHLSLEGLLCSFGNYTSLFPYNALSRCEIIEEAICSCSDRLFNPEFLFLASARLDISCESSYLFREPTKLTREKENNSLYGSNKSSKIPPSAD
jgi:hypothetical protein